MNYTIFITRHLDFRIEKRTWQDTYMSHLVPSVPSLGISCRDPYSFDLEQGSCNQGSVSHFFHPCKKKENNIYNKDILTKDHHYHSRFHKTRQSEEIFGSKSVCTPQYECACSRPKDS